jgi:hypothetical protein
MKVISTPAQSSIHTTQQSSISALHHIYQRTMKSFFVQCSWKGNATRVEFEVLGKHINIITASRYSLSNTEREPLLLAGRNSK